MPTGDQLKSEPEWGAQFVPPNLKAFVAQLEAYYDPSVVNVGAYGDYRHLKGYHRSRRWIRESRYCTNDSYSVTETQGNRSGGDENAISGVDLILGQARSTQVWERVNVAKQQGRLPFLRENKLERSPWHNHFGIDRGYSNGDFAYFFAVITGQADPHEGTVVMNIEMPALRNGAEGVDVVTAQALLGARGFTTALDGEFGPHTEAQTRTMQQQFGAESVDGIWGPETWTIAITGEDRL